MSIDNLPPELLVQVVDFLAVEEEHLASYATLSRAWQHAIEKHTFAELNLSSAELPYFEKVVSQSSFIHRRAILRDVHFSIVLPNYDDNACGRFERASDEQINNEAFSQAIAGLFDALSTHESAGDARPIQLSLEHFYSPMDCDQRGIDKLSADKHVHAIGKRNDLIEHRYEDSYLRLLHSDKLPTLNKVVSLTDNDEGLEDPYDSDMISDIMYDFDSSESFFANGELPPDQYGSFEERRDDRLDGREPVRQFRPWPTPELEKLFEAAARAVIQMPELQPFSVGLSVGMVDTGCYTLARLGFAYLVPGNEHRKDLEPVIRNMLACIGMDPRDGHERGSRESVEADTW